MACPGEVEESGVEEREVDGGFKGGWQGGGGGGGRNHGNERQPGLQHLLSWIWRTQFRGRVQDSSRSGVGGGAGGGGWSVGRCLAV